MKDRVIYTSTFRSTMLPSLRFGFVVVPPDLVDSFVRMRFLADGFRPALDQGVDAGNSSSTATLLLTSGGCWASQKMVVNTLREQFLPVARPADQQNVSVDLRENSAVSNNHARSQSDVAIVREESNEVSQIAGGDAELADELPIRQPSAGRGGRRRAGQDRHGAGSSPHAGRGPQRRGA